MIAMANESAVDASPPRSFTAVERLIKTLPPIESIWAALPNMAAVAELKQRERLLGVASLSGCAFESLHQIISDLNVYHVIIRHPPSVKAGAKQDLIAGRLNGATLLVNKTVTVRLERAHFLLTGAGDYTVSRQLLRQIADRWHLPRRTVKACRINPVDYSPESELGLLTGMVSPFVAPSLSLEKLRGVVLLATPHIDAAADQMVAISLSPFESLVVRLVDFEALAFLYARRTYPHLPWTKMRG